MHTLLLLLLLMPQAVSEEAAELETCNTRCLIYTQAFEETLLNGSKRKDPCMWRIYAFETHRVFQNCKECCLKIPDKSQCGFVNNETIAELRRIKRENAMDDVQTGCYCYVHYYEETLNGIIEILGVTEASCAARAAAVNVYCKKLNTRLYAANLGFIAMLHTLHADYPKVSEGLYSDMQRRLEYVDTRLVRAMEEYTERCHNEGVLHTIGAFGSNPSLFEKATNK